MAWKVGYSAIFHAKLGNSMQLCAAALKSKFCTKSWRDCLILVRSQCSSCFKVESLVLEFGFQYLEIALLRCPCQISYATTLGLQEPRSCAVREGVGSVQ